MLLWRARKERQPSGSKSRSRSQKEAKSGEAYKKSINPKGKEVVWAERNGEGWSAARAATKGYTCMHPIESLRPDCAASLLNTKPSPPQFQPRADRRSLQRRSIDRQRSKLFSNLRADCWAIEISAARSSVASFQSSWPLVSDLFRLFRSKIWLAKL